MSITSDEVNFLVYRYLQENGFAHSAFTFAYESLVIKSTAAQTEIPPGALITFLQKGLEYIAIEEHIAEDGTIQDFDNNYSLLSPLICESVAAKEDRRNRVTPSSSSSGSAAIGAGNNGTTAADGNGSMVVPMEEDEVPEQKVIPSTYNLAETSGNKILQLKGHQGDVFMCVWNPIKRQIASGSADGVCRLWGLWDLTSDSWALPVSNGSEGESQQNLKVITAIMPHCDTIGQKLRDVTSISWSPTGHCVATGCYDGMARIWDENGSLLKKLQHHEGPVFSLKWNKAGSYILSGSYDRRSIVWDPNSGTMVKCFSLHSGPVLDVDWKDDDVFATCSSDKTIYICSVSQTEPSSFIGKLEGHTDEVNAVVWSPGGRYLASCSDDSTAKIWDYEQICNKDSSKYLRHDLLGHTKEIFTLRWTPTGKGSHREDLPLYLCTASFDGTVKVWDGESGQIAFNLAKDSQPVYSLAPSPDGKFLASGSLGGKISIWALDKGESVKDIEGSGDTFDVSWSYDGSLLCSCFSSGALFVLDTSSLHQS